MEWKICASLFSKPHYRHSGFLFLKTLKETWSETTHLAGVLDLRISVSAKRQGSGDRREFVVVTWQTRGMCLNTSLATTFLPKPSPNRHTYLSRNVFGRVKVMGRRLITSSQPSLPFRKAPFLPIIVQLYSTDAVSKAWFSSEPSVLRSCLLASKCEGNCIWTSTVLKGIFSDIARIVT